MNKIIYKLNKWIIKYSFHLKISKKYTDEVDFDTKIIQINKNTNINSQIITILHECGHILIYLQRKKYKLKTIAGSNWKEWNKLFIKKKSIKKKITVLEEEIEAWNRGKKLAKKLKININNKTFEYHKIRSLNTYIK